MSNYSSETMGVTNALSKLSFSDSLKKYIDNNQNMWANFGKMTSHLYREKLMKLMDNNGLTSEAKFMVFFFFSVIKNQPRVLKELNNMPSETKAEPWYNPTRDFIASHVTQYVTATTGNSKMPAVNIPSCNPGMDILVYCLITNPADIKIENVRNRTTFTQLYLNDDLQAEAKVGYAHYWNNVVKGTKNEQKTEAPKMRDDYYETIAGDRYKLLSLDLKEIEAPNGGYDRKFVEKYFKDIIKSLSKSSS